MTSQTPAKTSETPCICTASCASAACLHFADGSVTNYPAEDNCTETIAQNDNCTKLVIQRQRFWKAQSRITDRITLQLTSKDYFLRQFTGIVRACLTLRAIYRPAERQQRMMSAGADNWGNHELIRHTN
jgi:hypothetical protein